MNEGIFFLLVMSVALQLTSLADFDRLGNKVMGIIGCVLQVSVFLFIIMEEANTISKLLLIISLFNLGLFIYLLWMTRDG